MSADGTWRIARQIASAVSTGRIVLENHNRRQFRQQRTGDFPGSENVRSGTFSALTAAANIEADSGFETASATNRFSRAKSIAVFGPIAGTPLLRRPRNRGRHLNRLAFRRREHFECGPAARSMERRFPTT